jgi:hypothetical protein
MAAPSYDRQHHGKTENLKYKIFYFDVARSFDTSGATNQED